MNVIAPTQDGKSTTIAAATVIVAATCPERFTIAAPSEKKADIIMVWIRDFATQPKIFSSQLELDKSDTLDRLKRERSKKNITFRGGGGVQTLTLDARNSKKNLEAAMGFGSKNIIADEAGLIDDVLWGTVVRMLGGDIKGDEQKKILIKIGNPFYRNHFFRTSKSSRYKQVLHRWQDSVRDYENGFYGYTPDFVEEMREEAGPLFGVMYDCNFPDEDEIDAKGYRQLVQSGWIKKGMVEPKGIPILGADIGGGGDRNVFTMRWNNFAKVVRTNQSQDTMTNVTVIQELLEEYPDLIPENVHIDDVGIGRGVRDRCHELNLAVVGVNSGERSTKPDKFANQNMEMAWDMRKWVKNEGMLEEFEIAGQSVWEQLTWYKYKPNSDKQMKMEPKADMKKRTSKSPDFGDSLRLTFYIPPRVGIMTF